jgi:CBS domain-containing membrane protein
VAATYARTDTVREVMTAHPVTVAPETPVSELYELMEQRGISVCPVVSRKGELHGIVSRVDVLRALRPSRELAIKDVDDVGRLPVRDIMRYGVVSLEADDPLVAAVDLFVDTRLHALPVVHRAGGPPMVVGIVTQKDVLRHVAHSAPPARP